MKFKKKKGVIGSGALWTSLRMNLCFGVSKSGSLDGLDLKCSTHRGSQIGLVIQTRRDSCTLQ